MSDQKKILTNTVSSGFVFRYVDNETGGRKAVQVIETDEYGNHLCSQDDVPEKKKKSLPPAKKVMEFSLEPMFSHGGDIFKRGFPLLVDAFAFHKKGRTDPFKSGGPRAYKNGVPPHSHLRKTNQWRWSD